MAADGGGSPALSAGEEEPPLGLESLVEEEAATAAPSAGFRLTAAKREPAVRLQHGVSGLEPLAWSEDHRVSVSTARSIAVLEQLSDVHSGGQEMVIHRTAVPAPAAACLLKVGPKKEVAECREKFASSGDPTVSQTFMLDRVFNPEGKSLPPLRGFKYSSWSPLGCDANGRCLLAALTLDNRLTIHANLNRLQWVQLVDLTDTYGERLYEANYKLCKGDAPRGELGDFPEFQRRHSMQTPVRMEWSGICTTQQVKHNNECWDVGSVLLAVLFENGHIAVWQFQLPFLGLNVHNSHVTGLHSLPIVSMTADKQNGTVYTCSSDGKEALDKKIESCGSTYFWRFKLFLLRILYQSMQKAPSEVMWRPSHEDAKILISDSPGMGSTEDDQEEGTSKQARKQSLCDTGKGMDIDDTADDSLPQSSDVGGREPMEEKLLEIQAQIEAVEMHLTREHMKRVLGEVYLHTWITENTSIPTRGVCDFLMSDDGYEDRTARVLIGHILKKMNKQTFPEHCSLCKEILPFTDRRQAVCSNGHIWLRCFLTYQSCQSLVYRRCLLHDSIARHPTPEDPEWIKRLLQGPCTFCDSPVF
ncbi:general transcription factor 3C polypeptide 4 isoform X4 [Heliangelus exortis]|uniref:general transcription factor 3C polypeptide 4 isoform X4 n=1 Tax=Heliangelus exortis TaxID=472823 RepID=UPI003A8CC781